MFCSFSSVYVSVFTAYSLHADIACRHGALLELSTVPQVCCPAQPLLSIYKIFFTKEKASGCVICFKEDIGCEEEHVSRT